MKLDEGGCIYGAAVLLRHLNALEQEIDGVREGGSDIEHIHRMRVATRRLRSALPLFGGCLPAKKTRAWRKQIRRLTAALGEARDADVQIEHLETFRQENADAHLRPGLDRLLLRLRQQRRKLQPDLARALDRLAQEGTLAQLRAALDPLAARAVEPALNTPALYQHALESVSVCLADLRSYDAIVADEQRAEELHRMRIAAKRLRYTLEAFAPLYASGLKKWLKAARDTQEMLGTIHDCDVWAVLIPAYLEKERLRTAAYFGHTRSFYRLMPGAQAYASARANERSLVHARFSVQWKSWSNAGLWEGLIEALSTAARSGESSQEIGE